MARRSGRLSGGGGTANKHKRSASGSSISGSAQKRAKKKQATPTKSQYFAAKDEDEEAEGGEESESPSAEDSGSDFAESDQAANEVSELEDEEDEEDELSDGKVSRRKAIPKLQHGTQVIIKKPKARPAGKTPYKDETIHPNTLLFLADLKSNNKREWLKSKYEQFLSCNAGQRYSVAPCE